jgi:hypothetical protein
MDNFVSTRSGQRLLAVRLSITVGLAVLLLAILLCVLREVTPAQADPGVLYVDGATGQDISTCGTPGVPCRTISHALNSRASSGDILRVAEGVYTENLTIDKRVTLEGGYAPSGTLWVTRTGETIIDGSNGRTVLGDWDGSRVHMSIVISDAGVYKMWYAGQDLVGSAGFGLATSPHGVAWTKYTGNPVLTATEDWEDGGLGHPHVIKDGAAYKMWYGPNDERIGYASSSDGIHWTRYAGNPIVEGTPGTWDEGGVGAPFVIKVGPDDYRMWYQDRELNGIGYATSANGTEWTKHTSPVLLPGPSGAWDDTFVADPNVLPDGSTYHMWYSGYNGDVIRIGYASSSDGITWNKSTSNPLLSAGAPGEWDDFGVGEPNVLFDGALYRMWFSGWRGEWGASQRGYATSANGINWTKYAGNPVLSPGTPGQWGRSVVEFIEGSDGSVLDGFTVRSGEAEHGGGVLIDRTDVTVRNCTVISNTSQEGGGVAVRGEANAHIASNNILTNTADGCGGGGVSIAGGSVGLVDANRIYFNKAGCGGGGVSIAEGAVATLTNNLIVRNYGVVAWDGDGVGMWDEATRAWIVNNTIAFNEAEGVQANSGWALVRNNIIYSNDGGIHNLGSGATVSSDHNAFWDNGWDYGYVISGIGDISADPVFVEVANGDLHLEMDSPCKDAGTATGAPTADIEGTLRDATPDIGAYEQTGSRNFLPLILRNAVAYKSLTLPLEPGCELSNPTLCGVVDSEGGKHGRFLVGDSPSNEGLQLFLSFDISGIPTQSEILDVIVDLTGSRVVESPFDTLGCLGVYGYDYGTLDYTDYFTGTPEGAIAEYGSEEELNSRTSSSEAVKSLQEKLGGPRFQIRFQFEEGTDNDSDCEWVDMESVPPDITVHYRNP